MMTEYEQKIAEMESAITTTMEKFSDEDKAALSRVASDAMGNNAHARKVLAELFPNVEMNLGAYYIIQTKGYSAMSERERDIDYIVAERNLAAVTSASKVSQVPSISALRLERKLSQKELAAKSGMSVYQIKKIESGEMPLQVLASSDVAAIASAFGMQASELR